MHKIKSIIKNLIVDIVGYFSLKYLIISKNKKNSKTYSAINKISNILMISEVDMRGGAAKLAYRMSKFLNKNGYTSRIVAGLITSPEEGIIELEKNNSIFSKILNLYAQKHNLEDLLKLDSFNILKLDDFKNADIVHLHNLHVNYFSKLALPQISALKRTVWTLHDSLDLYEDLPENPVGEISTHANLTHSQKTFLREVSQKVINNSHIQVVSPSKWLKEKAENGIFKGENIKLIYNGVDEEVFKPFDKNIIRKELGIPQDKFIMIFSAAWGVSAGTKDSFDAIQGVLEKYKDNEDVAFVVIGGGMENDDKKIINAGYINNDVLLAKYYSSADLFLYPSLWDNCPFTVIESLAVGTPIITFQTGGIPELVDHMQNGYVAKYKDTEDFLKGVDLFVNSKELRNAASLKAVDKFKTKFTLKQMLNNYIELYNELI
jgi:glycosyltransferase involved in cell wall biosynthesis